MPHRSVSTDQAAPPGGPYAQATVAGDFVYLAGATPKRPDGSLVEGSFAEQARAVFDNLAAVAQAAGARLDQAVRVGVYLRDMADFPEMNAIFEEYFPEPRPARTTVPVDLPGFPIEVDAVLYTG
ncbi:RidA family protein [Pseudonocardia nigra]|uniref:RidA family protein n=1 Tax=Pseudonocardia nigra TaxID=1921578 RepID=UPI001C605B5B|nr:RidA family protein [Pseudonocardia nigra]